MGYLRKRFGEPSTYAGLSLAAMLISTAFPQYAALAQAIAALCAGGSVALPDPGNR